MSVTVILYLIELLSNLSMALEFFIFTYVVFIGVSLLWWSCPKYNLGDQEKANKTLKRVSDKWWVLMLGSSFMASSPMPAKVSQILELKLDDVLSELKEEVKK